MRRRQDCTCKAIKSRAGRETAGNAATCAYQAYSNVFQSGQMRLLTNSVSSMQHSSSEKLRRSYRLAGNKHFWPNCWRASTHDSGQLASATCMLQQLMRACGFATALSIPHTLSLRSANASTGATAAVWSLGSAASLDELAHVVAVTPLLNGAGTLGSHLLEQPPAQRRQ